MPSLSLVEGWHAPAGRRTCETPASDPGQADQTGSAGGARKPGPGRQIVSQDNASASAESKVRPGPRPLTLRPHHRKTAEAGPEALSTVSLPSMSDPQLCQPRERRHTDRTVLSVLICRALSHFVCAAEQATVITQMTRVADVNL